MRHLASIGLLALTLSAEAASQSSFEKAWAAAHGGKCNVRLADGTRADVLTDTSVVDVVFAEEWQAAIGRVLNQALQSGRRAGILLIIQKDRENQYLARLRFVIGAYNLPIDVWSAGPAARPTEAPY